MRLDWPLQLARGRGRHRIEEPTVIDLALRNLRQRRLQTLDMTKRRRERPLEAGDARLHGIPDRH